MPLHVRRQRRDPLLVGWQHCGCRQAQCSGLPAKRQNSGSRWAFCGTMSISTVGCRHPASHRAKLQLPSWSAWCPGREDGAAQPSWRSTSGTWAWGLRHYRAPGPPSPSPSLAAGLQFTATAAHNLPVVPVVEWTFGLAQPLLNLSEAGDCPLHRNRSSRGQSSPVLSLPRDAVCGPARLQRAALATLHRAAAPQTARRTPQPLPMSVRALALHDRAAAGPPCSLVRAPPRRPPDARDVCPRLTPTDVDHA